MLVLNSYKQQNLTHKTEIYQLSFKKNSRSVLCNFCATHSIYFWHITVMLIMWYKKWPVNVKLLRNIFLQISCFWPYKSTSLYIFIIFKKKKQTNIIFFFHFNGYFTQGINISILTILSHFANFINNIEPLWKKEDVCSSVFIFF